MKMEPKVKMEKALMHLVLHKPFYGALVLKLKVEPSPFAKTCYTDGRVLRYNAQYIDALPFNALVTVLAHEVMHCALLHPYRRGQRDLKLWNEACDHAINLLLMKDEDGFEFPGREFGDYLCDDRFEGQSAEEIYSTLLLEQPPQPPQPQPQPQAQQQSGDGEGQPSASPSASGEPSEEEEESSEQQDKTESGKSDQKSKPDKKKSDQPDKQQGKQDEQSEESSEDGDDNGESGDHDGEGEQEEGDADADGSSEPEQQQEPESEGDGAQQEREAPGSSMGDVLDAGTSAESDGDDSEGSGRSEAERQEQAEDWSAAVAAAAMQAEMAGHLSADQVRMVRKQFEPQTDFSDYLRMFLARISRDDQSWSRPARRSEAAGAYLPTQRSEATGKLVLGIDTSGSIDDRQLAIFESEVQAVHADLKPEEIIVLYCDSRVKNEERIGPYDDVRFVQPKGGGGTSFVPVFKRVQQLKDEGEQIAGLIYLTDLDGSFPDADKVDPELPVLWVATEREVPPFGEVTYLRAGR